MTAPRPIFRTTAPTATDSAAIRSARAALNDKTAITSAPSGLRALAEWLVLLALAVTLFRCFGVEGYMISTGSMAPSLLGYHTRITCPACGLTFAHGVAPPEEDSVAVVRVSVAEAQSVAFSEGGPETVACPNCSRKCPVGALPERAEGDQLLVHKDAYAWRSLARRGGPRRWEIAVFRNPDDARMAYVKRIAGLPGEAIELVDGDVYANGTLQRKALTAQLSTRIPVSLTDHPVTDDDPNWEARWSNDGAGADWQIDGSKFVHVMNAPSRNSPTRQSQWHWITYRHWIRSGGATTTSVPLEQWPESLAAPDPLLSPLDYDPAAHRLTCLGALPHVQWERWDAATRDADFHAALWELFRESHVAPIIDSAPYNTSGSGGANPVRDLLVELTLEWRGGSGQFALEMTDGAREFRCELDLGRGELQIVADGQETLFAGQVTIERDTPTILLMSTFDEQLLLAQDGELLCDPIPYERGDEPPAPLRRPVRFGVRDASVVVDHVGLYRDIYYTPPPGGAQTFMLQEGEYFVLGDNSSVSVDSRHWQRPGVPESALIGKPLFVHLPSRPLRLEWGGKVRQIRVPDFERIRYIR
ncbi:MAG: hypothetical protein JNG89_01290 [Planctomycetaceae bacterium]|nr:hypothetical protein [Planctomycetaceae bacterium]